MDHFKCMYFSCVEPFVTNGCLPWSHTLSLSLSKLSTLSFLYGKPICAILLTTYESYVCKDKQQSSMASHRSIRTYGPGRELHLVFAHHPESKKPPRQKKTRTRLEQVKWSKHEPFWFGGFGESCRVFHQYVQHVGMQCPTARCSPEILAKSLWIFLFFEPPPVSQ